MFCYFGNSIDRLFAVFFCWLNNRRDEKKQSEYQIWPSYYALKSSFRFGKGKF